MTEHQIVVVLDISAPNRLSAARAAVGLLNGTRGRYLLPTGTTASTTVEDWWFPEADLKAVDGNDNAAGRLVFDSDDDGQDDYCGGCGAHGDDPHRAQCRHGEGCLADDPDCESSDGASHDGCDPKSALDAAS